VDFYGLARRIRCKQKGNKSDNIVKGGEGGLSHSVLNMIVLKNENFTKKGVVVYLISNYYFERFR
jgi:hypothetical protein